MSFEEAKEHIGKLCSIQWIDHQEREQMTITVIKDVIEHPRHGGYLLTTNHQIRLDSIEVICSVIGIADDPVAKAA